MAHLRLAWLQQGFQDRARSDKNSCPKWGEKSVAFEIEFW